jgi:hypothetical protein
MAAPPISRLQFAQQEIDRVFGDGYATAHPGIVAAVMQSAATGDYAAQLIAHGLGQIANALLVEDEPTPAENSNKTVRGLHAVGNFPLTLTCQIDVILKNKHSRLVGNNADAGCCRDVGTYHHRSGVGRGG